jgi:hypothetical protein
VVIARALWRARGALTLRRDGSGFVMQSARSKNFDRPWSPEAVAPIAVPRTVPPIVATEDRATSQDAAAKPVEDRAKSANEGTTLRARADDVSPREEDIEADE